MGRSCALNSRLQRRAIKAPPLLQCRSRRRNGELKTLALWSPVNHNNCPRDDIQDESLGGKEDEDTREVEKEVSINAVENRNKRDLLSTSFCCRVARGIGWGLSKQR